MIYFRVDSNPAIASGHVMRCLSVARAFREKSLETLFLVSDEQSSEPIRSAGFPVLVLHSRWDELSGEVEQVKSILKGSCGSLLFVDTYSVTRGYVEALRPYAEICYLGSKREYLGKLSVLINYSVDIDEDFYRSSYGDSPTRLLLGPRFAPLRREYQNTERQFHKKVRRILITTGSTDADCVADKIISSLLSCEEINDVVLDAVIGSMYGNREELHRKYGAEKRVNLHENVTDMWNLMKECDLAVSAGGTTVYELAASFVPSVIFAMVPEQARDASVLGMRKAAVYCGRLYEQTGECLRNIVRAVREHCNSYEKRYQMMNTAHYLIDGKGCLRIAEALAGFME